MKKYNKSEIMSRAWKVFNNTDCTFSEALQFAWKKAKEAMNKVTVQSLVKGDVIEIEYGDYNNIMKVTIVNIGETQIAGMNFLEIHAITENGMKIEFCAKPDEGAKIIRKFA